MKDVIDKGVVRLYEFTVKKRVHKHIAMDGLAVLSRNDQAAAIFRATFSDEPREAFMVFHLDVRCRIIGLELIAIGSATNVEVHPREVFRGALLSGAFGIVLSHNHPSGDPTPSPEDDALSEQLMGCGKLLNLPVIDHIVICDDSHYSYAAHGRAPWPATEFPNTTSQS